MPDIVLSTLNAKFIHASFGLRYLLANLGELRPRATLAEFEIKQPALEIVEALLRLHPRIVGFGVYIWNIHPTHEVVTLLKRLAPEVIVVLGGPEVSHETAEQPIVQLADHTLTGEADLAFAKLCLWLLADRPGVAGENVGSGEWGVERLGQVECAESGVGSPVQEGSGESGVGSSNPGTLPTPHPRLPTPKVIEAELPDLTRLNLPYEEYTAEDLAHRVIYVEASRGCPFTCEFCLSSLEIPVRQFPLDRFLPALDRLLARGARQFKFVDRTFNLNLAVSRAILRFFRERWTDGLFLHFEMIPDRLPEALREDLAWFPAGAVQLEIGIQSLNSAVCERIRRRQDVARTADNFRFLREHTGVHLHADLIVGLPGESLESFGEGFDRLVGMRPQEIQVGVLKRLRGTPIVRHDAEWAMCYSPLPPYEILANRDLDFLTLQRLRRFARHWDLVANSGRFTQTLPLVWPNPHSPFQRFFAFSDWMHAELRQTHGIALDRLARAIFRWLTEKGGIETRTAADALRNDWHNAGQRDLPPWLAPHVEATSRRPPTRVPRPTGSPLRQSRHLTPSDP